MRGIYYGHISQGLNFFGICKNEIDGKLVDLKLGEFSCTKFKNSF